MMNFSEGCVVCGRELVYDTDYKPMTCFFCGKETGSNVSCPEGHFICDNCHASSANSLIEQFCIHTNLTDPVEISELLMRQAQIKMHGPEHHFLVPAVLLAAYYNISGDEAEKEKKIKIAHARASKIAGGFCGTHGNCGAAVGTGIFISLITGATPLSGKEWKYSNMATGRALLEIAEKGGPRCCKRDSFIAIQNVIKFLKEKFDFDMPASHAHCEFSSRNKQCTQGDCYYYQN